MNEDLEIHLAIQSMTIKAKNRCHKELYYLSQRLETLRQDKKLQALDLPASPGHIAAAFQSVSSQFELEQKITVDYVCLVRKKRT